MSWTNYHGHCKYCDGHGEIEEYIQQAIKNGMKKIGVSSHAPVPFDCFWTMKQDKLITYLNEIKNLKIKYKSEIEILTSLEIDYIPNVTGPDFSFFEDIKLDYIIGSIHFVDRFSNGKHWEMLDGGYELFIKGLDEIFGGDTNAMVKRFFRLNREMIETQNFDIIGHLDKVKSINVYEDFFNEKSEWYIKEIESTLDLIASKNVIVEINTKSFEKNGLLFPSVEFFDTMFKKGIGVTINSDAHFPDKLEVGYNYVAEELYKTGFRSLKEFNNGKWIDVPFTKKGLIW